MIVSLTARLVALPERGWPRLAAACDADEPLPSPLGHACFVAALPVVMTTIGAATVPGTTAGRVALAALAAVLGYVGAAVAAVTLAPRWVRPGPRAERLGPRFASAAALPLLASGVLNLVPLVGLGFLWLLAGAGATAWSAHVGASSLLGIEGDGRRRTAIVVPAIGAVPIALSTVLRFFITP